MNFKIEYDQEDIDVVHDILLEFHYPEEVDYTDEEILAIMRFFPDNIELSIARWGSRDTVVREFILTHFRERGPEDKRQKLIKPFPLNVTAEY